MEWKILREEKTNLLNKKKFSSLAIGNVQSGKTQFMIKETKYALDNDYQIVFILGGTNNLLLKQSYFRFINNFKITGYPVYPIKSSDFERVPSNSKIIITSLKQKDSLEKMISIIKNNSEKRILVFDDESDFGGINTHNIGESKIYSQLRNVWNSIECGGYISVTATPYADILSKDAFSFDQIIRLIPNEGYFGVKEFNNFNKYKIINKNDELIKKIVKILIDHINKILKNNLKISEFLINPGLKNEVHNKFQDYIIKSLFIIEGNISSFFSKNILFAKEIVKGLIKNIYTLNINNSNWQPGGHSIIIGGALISRGFTFPNLITFILLSESSSKLSADTLLQRCRWFGYRKDKFNFMDIFIPEKTLKALKEAEKLNEIIFKKENAIEDIKNEIKEMDWKYLIPSGKVI